MKTIYSVGILLLSIFITTSCNEPDSPSGSQFDRSMMLDNYAKELIMPGLNSAANWSRELRAAVNGLATANSISQTNLENTQAIWKQAYEEYLKISMYNFGPAAEAAITRSLVEEVATFPVSVARITAKTQTETPNFADFERDSRGFLALDYLLFNENALENLNANPNYRNYTLKVAEDIEKRIETVNENWKTYQTEFISNNGTDAGSSTSLLYNEFVKSYEGLKNFKVGLPLGIRPGQTRAEPEKVEALYSGLSLSFLKTQFDAIVNVWQGVDGIGLDDYLQNVEGGPALVLSTKDQINVIENVLNQFPANAALSELIQANETSVTNLHTELQRHTRFFKSELSSLLGIAITFTSGDGD